MRYLGHIVVDSLARHMMPHLCFTATFLLKQAHTMWCLWSRRFVKRHVYTTVSISRLMLLLGFVNIVGCQRGTKFIYFLFVAII